LPWRRQPPQGARQRTAARLAAILVRRSVLAQVLRKALFVGVLLAASVVVATGILCLPAGDKGPPAPEAQVPPHPKPAPRPAFTLGLFDHNLDIGGPNRAGAAHFGDDAYNVQGGGANIYGKADQFRFVCRVWAGDGEISARIASDPLQEAKQASAGVMFRESLAPESPHMAVMLTTGQCHVTYRTPTSPGSQCHVSPLTAADKHWVRLVRRGDKLTAYVRADEAEGWTRVKEMKLALGPSPYVGLAVTARNDARLAAATFDYVSVGSEP
jgi:hypothetical protein